MLWGVYTMSKPKVLKNQFFEIKENKGVKDLATLQ